MKLSATEWTIMQVVWERHPVSARDVWERVKGETGWAFDTVRTILNRLAKKGNVQSELRSNTAFFTPLLTQEEARQSALSWITDKAFGGAREALLEFLVSPQELSRKEREELQKLLTEMEQGDD